MKPTIEITAANFEAEVLKPAAPMLEEIATEQTGELKVRRSTPPSCTRATPSK